MYCCIYIIVNIIFWFIMWKGRVYLSIYLYTEEAPRNKLRYWHIFLWRGIWSSIGMKISLMSPRKKETGIQNPWGIQRNLFSRVCSFFGLRSLSKPVKSTEADGPMLLWNSWWLDQKHAVDIFYISLKMRQVAKNDYVYFCKSHFILNAKHRQQTVHK